MGGNDPARSDPPEPGLHEASEWTIICIAIVELALIAMILFVSLGANKVSSRREIFLAVAATGIFMFAIMLQGAASVLLSACER